MAKIKVVLPKVGPRNGGHVDRWIPLIMLPHDNNTISFRCFVLDRGREVCTSLVDGALAEVLTWEAMNPELLGEVFELVAK